MGVEYNHKETRNFLLIANPDAVLRLIDQIGSSNLGVLLDTGHTMYAKEDLPTTVEKLEKHCFMFISATTTETEMMTWLQALFMKNRCLWH